MKTKTNYKILCHQIIFIFLLNITLRAQIQLQVPAVLGLPIEKAIAPTSIIITWKSNVASSGVVRFGKVDGNNLYTDSIFSNEKTLSHSIKLENLIPASMYNCSVGSSDSSGTGYSRNFIFSTASPASVSGAMWVYFSKSVNTTVSIGENATTTNLASKFIERINAANYSIDVCLYSLSGNVGSEITTALISAKNRGLKIRFIAEEDNSNTSPITALKNSGIPFITDKFDVLAQSGYMHNKFAIFDNRESSSFEDDFIWMGSWNATDPGTNNDAQNSVLIQDVALANAYTREFEEMWGSSTETPNQTNCRFGNRKTNNTPHKFNINNTEVELYFSPSDGTTSQIYNALSSGIKSINASLLSFTRDDLAQIIIQKKNQGLKARILMDNNSDTGNEFLNLQNSGVDVLLRPSNFGGMFHHKYALVDADDKNIIGKVVTGSHNWSNSAENANNENTLIISSKRISNLFLQEFKARYIEAGGKDNIVLTSIKKIKNELENVELSLFPNPANPKTTIKFSVDNTSFTEVKIYSIAGQLIETLVSENLQQGSYNINYNSNSLSSGAYLIQLCVNNRIKTLPLLILK